MTASKGRIASVDALRGLDMAIILGIDVLSYRVVEFADNPVTDLIARQLSHADWIGVHVYDLIFPLFIFLSGTSIGIALGRRGPAALSLRKALRRAVILVFLGVVYNFGWDWSADRFRLPSVLGLIGISGLIATVGAIAFRNRIGRLSLLVTLLGVLTILQLLIPVPEHGAGQLTATGSMNTFLDQLMIPGRLHGGAFDPEGVLSVLAGGAIGLAGVEAGVLLTGTETHGAAVRYLFASGVIALAIGFALSPSLPPIKKLWTLSFDLFAIGWSAIALGVAILLFDGRSPKVARPFCVIGANAILAYVGARFLVYPFTWQWSATLAPVPAILTVAALLAVQWCILFILYRRGIFFKV